MKKFLIAVTIFIIPLVLIFQNIEPTSASCDEVIQLDDVNSNTIVNYLKENDLNVTYVCSYSFCQKMRSSSIEDDIITFQDDYYEYIKNRVDEETYQTIYLKGFKITTIRVNNCIS